LALRRRRFVLALDPDGQKERVLFHLAGSALVRLMEQCVRGSKLLCQPLTLLNLNFLPLVMNKVPLLLHMVGHEHLG
jgi:hypothetical protein